MAATAAAAARDATRLEALVCFFLYSVHITLIYFQIYLMRRNGDGSNSRGSRRVNRSGSAAAATSARLEPLDTFFFLIIYLLLY